MVTSQREAHLPHTTTHNTTNPITDHNRITTPPHVPITHRNNASEASGPIYATDRRLAAAFASGGVGAVARNSLALEHQPRCRDIARKAESRRSAFECRARSGSPLSVALAIEHLASDLNCRRPECLNLAHPTKPSHFPTMMDSTGCNPFSLTNRFLLSGCRKRLIS